MKPLPSNSLEAAVRLYLGITQAELARLLGVTRGQVAHAEAGRRVLNGEASRLLLVLAELLPPPLGSAQVEAEDSNTSEAGPLDPNPIRRRQKRCLWKASNMRWTLGKLQAREQRARHWQQVLPRLQATLPTDPATVEGRRTQRWLELRSAEAADALDAAGATTRALLRVRIASLEMEAAELGKLLVGSVDA